LVVAQVDIDLGVPLAAGVLQPVERQPGREHHGPAHEDRVGHAAVTELADYPFGAVEVVIGELFDLAVVRMHHRPSVASGPTASQTAGRALCTLSRSALSCSASRKASSSAWLALRRGSHCV